MASHVLSGIPFHLIVFVFAISLAQSQDDTEDCNLTTKRTLTVIKSIRFPETYFSGLDCEYTVKRRSKSVCSVTFLFNVLDLFHSEKCSEDYLQFDDTGEKICGSKPVGYSRTISFKPFGNKSRDGVTMKFHSSNSTTGGLGFMITVVQQECPKKSCDFEESDDDFVLTSPNYPLPYDNSRTCTFTIHRSKPAICKLHLVVRKFELEKDDECNADYLRLGDGRRLCGDLQQGQIVEANFENDTMVLEFQSDHFTTANGFQLEARQIECLSSATKKTNAEKRTPSKDFTSLETTNDIDTKSYDVTTPIPKEGKDKDKTMTTN